MSSHPPLKLSVLRDIGWREWDPIGLAGNEGDWGRSAAADEYDRYLLHVAVRLQAGDAEDALVNYLYDAETDRMGLSPNQGALARARSTVNAILGYVRSLT